MVVDIFNTKKEYDLILADPPWRQTKGNERKCRPNQGKALDYPTCSLDEIEKHLQKAVELTGKNSVLFLWTIDKYLFDAQRIAERIGYKLHARMIWDKMNGVPCAFTIRFGHEYLLWLYRGKMRPIAFAERGKIHSVFAERAKKHSQKPEISFEIIERLYPYERKLELYARRPREGWDSWGNEIDNIQKSLVADGKERRREGSET